jgi:hypothetical protein
MADEQQFKQPSKISPSEQVVHWTTEVDSLTKLIGGYEVKLETLGENEQQDANKAMADSIGLGYIISGLREDLAAAERELQAASAAFGEPLGAGEDHVSTTPSRTAVSASRNHSADTRRQLSFRTASEAKSKDEQDGNGAGDQGIAFIKGDSDTEWTFVFDEARLNAEGDEGSTKSFRTK